MFINRAQCLLIFLLVGCTLSLAHRPPAPAPSPDIHEEEPEEEPDTPPTEEEPDTDDPDKLPDDIYNNTHNICANLRTMRDLIPQDTLRSLISEHYMRDARFRRAMDFMQTASFKVAAARFTNTNAYQQLLAQLRRAGIELIDIENLTIIFNCIIIMPPSNYYNPPAAPPNDNVDDMPNYPPLIPEYDYDDYGYNPGYYRTQARSLQSFAMDVMTLMPKNRLKALFAANMERGTQFGKFYRVVRKQGFQRNFLRSLNSRQMVPINRSFKRHNVDMRRLIAVFFRIINTGPLPDFK